MNKRTLLVIMDGWGEGNDTKSNVINNAKVPFTQGLYNNPQWAVSKLKTSGEDVGLPTGQMGNSEVGHLNIGAGRIVYQDLVRINKAIKDNSISQNKELLNAYKYAKKNNKQVHFIGLVSDGGVHSLSKHLMKLCEVAKENEINDVFVHALMDGRDTDPKSGKGYMSELVEHLDKHTTAKVASVSGRYYGMDRDKRWERIKLAYDMLVKGIGNAEKDPVKAIEKSYSNGVTDEFIKPVVIVDDNNKPLTTIKQGDVVICFNFRTDRLREITTVLTQQDMPDFDMKTMPLHYVTMTRYDESFKNVHILFDKVDIKNTMGEVLSKESKKQLRIAETEKYAHVTFFFSGGVEKEYEGEERILIPSPKVATYDLQPSMSAVEVKDAVVEQLKKQKFDFICLNFANADMVGHTGVYPAIQEAVETVDTCVKEVAETAIENDYSILITADHGNADYAVNDDGSPNTAHSTNPVPCFLYNKDVKQVKDGRLADIAPTLLSIMGIDVPEEMTGSTLV